MTEKIYHPEKERNIILEERSNRINLTEAMNEFRLFQEELQTSFPNNYAKKNYVIVYLRSKKLLTLNPAVTVCTFPIFDYKIPSLDITIA